MKRKKINGEKRMSEKLKEKKKEPNFRKMSKVILSGVSL